MVKVILQLYPQVKATRQERIDQRPLGRDADRYQALIREMPTIVRAADELGFWGVATIEHHFHSEGYEVGPNPGRPRRLLGGDHQEHPGRPARLRDERAEPVPRGGGRRRSSTTSPTAGPSSASPAATRRAGRTSSASTSGRRPRSRPSGYQEKMAELDEATQAAPDLRRPGQPRDLRGARRPGPPGLDPGQHRVQGPLADPLPLRRGRRLDDDGHPRDRCAGRDGRGRQDPPGQRRPQPATKPYPPIFVSSNASQETVEYCGPRGFIPTYFTKIERAAEFGAAYVDAAAAGGRDLRARPEPGHRALGADRPRPRRRPAGWSPSTTSTSSRTSTPARPR